LSRKYATFNLFLNKSPHWNLENSSRLLRNIRKVVFPIYLFILTWLKSGISIFTIYWNLSIIKKIIFNKILFNKIFYTNKIIWIEIL
jgi:hypothetical protein